VPQTNKQTKINYFLSTMIRKDSPQEALTVSTEPSCKLLNKPEHPEDPGDNCKHDDELVSLQESATAAAVLGLELELPYLAFVKKLKKGSKDNNIRKHIDMEIGPATFAWFRRPCLKKRASAAADGSLKSLPFLTASSTCSESAVAVFAEKTDILDPFAEAESDSFAPIDAPKFCQIARGPHDENECLCCQLRSKVLSHEDEERKEMIQTRSLRRAYTLNVSTGHNIRPKVDNSAFCNPNATTEHVCRHQNQIRHHLANCASSKQRLFYFSGM